MNRRRFLLLSAAALAPVAGHAQTLTIWQGRGLGTALTLRLAGVDPAQAHLMFEKVQAEIALIEQQMSLYCDSALVRLNRDGHLTGPSPALLEVLDLAGQVHDATGGAFDPTVQPLWQATALGQETAAARDLIGWARVQITSEVIRLDRGQQLTLNGLAQGWAADRIAALLRRQGFGNVLVDMGELVALGDGPAKAGWPAAIAGPDGRILRNGALADRALATSSPLGTMIGAGRPHILGPQGQPTLWQTVSVSAPRAVVADALSTAFCLMDSPAIMAALQAFPGARLEALA